MTTDPDILTDANVNAVSSHIWRSTVLAAINDALSVNLSDSADAHTAANAIIGGVRDIHKWQGQAADVARAVTAERDELASKLAAVTIERDAAVTERNNCRAHSNFCLDSERIYHQTLAARLDIPQETVTDADALCDALAPRLVAERLARAEAAEAARHLPDLLIPDADGHLPAPGSVIRLLANALAAARDHLAHADEARDTAQARAEALDQQLAHAHAEIGQLQHRLDMAGDAAHSLGKSLCYAGGAIADLVRATR